MEAASSMPGFGIVLTHHGNRHTLSQVAEFSGGEDLDDRIRAYGGFNQALGSVDDDDVFADGIYDPEGCAATAEKSQATAKARKGGLSVITFCSFHIVAVVGRSGGYRVCVGGRGWGSSWWSRQAASLGLGHLPQGGEVGVPVVVQRNLICELLTGGGSGQRQSFEEGTKSGCGGGFTLRLVSTQNHAAGEGPAYAASHQNDYCCYNHERLCHVIFFSFDGHSARVCAEVLSMSEIL